MPNPTLPPSLGAEFAAVDRRLSALERGDRQLTYRQALTTNDASVARERRSADGGFGDMYSAALVNPRYPVMVARWLVYVMHPAQARIQLHAGMPGHERLSRVWELVPASTDPGFRIYVMTVAWLHGMPIEQWGETAEQTRLRLGNIQFRCQVTKDALAYPREELTAGGVFTGVQAARLRDWFGDKSNLYPVFFREPEYVFLAPRTAFPMASPEGTEINPGAAAAYLADSNNGPERSLWPNQPGVWPLPPRDFGYQTGGSDE
ncbi:hypothetical protein [Crossiella sp. CA198]|uniref:hypothetical protein n=1 Tax=Crossiella sp. CA198 TaxID=3455607 RepID=UPI003F8D060E